ncbi:MAG: thiamine pyrophosphate-dependent enzyme, partial [Chloroflexota bacterium]|nr:thiamine pyrophosphate-dependent enzyme [Chloroflexota bacterium]
HSCIHAAHTFMAKGALDDADSLALPAVGLQRPGADLATVPALAEADVVITVGYDQVEWSPALWNPDRAKTIVHIDSTPAEIDGHYLPEVEVVGEIGESLRALAATVPAREHRDRNPHAPYPMPDDHTFPLRPLRVVADLRAALADDDVVICDVGAHKVWLARAYPTAKPNTVIVSNGFASMGIALPGAIAAKLVHPDRKVVAFCGDGGFLMNVQELETAKRIGTAIVAVVLVDDRYGVIETNQLRRFGRAASIEFGNPDFVALARAFGVAGYAIERTEDLLPTLRRALAEDGPAVVAVPIDHRENAKLGDVLR